MNLKKMILIFTVLAGCLFSIDTGADEPEKRVMNFIAVMDLKCGKGIDADVCNSFTDIIIGELVKIGKYTVIDRANRDKILSEQGFQQTGCVKGSCTVEAGQLLGVGKLVVGSITKIGQTYLINLQLINVQTASVEISSDEECKCELDGLIQSVRNATRKLMGQILIPQPATGTQSQPGEIPPRPEDIKFIVATQEQQKHCLTDMVYIPSGWFMMGCNSTKDSNCQSDEYPYHPVYLNGFCIDKYEYPNKAGEKPKNNVNWPEANELCNSMGKRLPTEAEWEKAARGTDGRVYPWGDNIDNEKQKLLTHYYNSGQYSWNVSPYGVMDMAGNLFEWVEDFYDSGYYQNGPAHSPQGATSGTGHASRSGAWTSNRPFYLRASARYGGIPPTRYDNKGFRCARTP